MLKTNLDRETFFNSIRIDPTELYNKPDTHLKNTNYYLKQFDKHHHKKFFLSWNWGSFFFGISWMFYRKLYLMALMIVLILDAYICALITTKIFSFLTVFLPGIFLLVFLPMLTNALYLNSMKYPNKRKKNSQANATSLLAGILCFITLPLIAIIPIMVVSLIFADIRNILL